MFGAKAEVVVKLRFGFIDVHILILIIRRILLLFACLVAQLLLEFGLRGVVILHVLYRRDESL